MIELRRLEIDPMSALDDVDNLLSGLSWRRPWYGRRSAYPALNVWSSSEGVVIDAELPGAEAKDVDISIQGDELTLRAKVNVTEPAKNEMVHRRERPYGEFARTLQLPFRAESRNVKAHYRNGILRVTVPRSEEDKPRKVAIEAA